MSKISEEQWNKRPQWCPHKDCQYLADSQSLMCKGRLPKPEPHEDDFNTHRLCINTEETGHGIFDLQINHTDAYLLSNLLKGI